MSQHDQRNWKEFVQIFDEIRQSLEKLESGVKLLGRGTEESDRANLLCSTIHNVFLIFLDIWIDAIYSFKEAPNGYKVPFTLPLI
jgi:hypothetical protein